MKQTTKEITDKLVSKNSMNTEYSTVQCDQWCMYEVERMGKKYKVVKEGKKVWIERKK